MPDGCIPRYNYSGTGGPGGAGTRLYSTAGTQFKKLCIQNDLHLLDASVRHLGTDINYIVLQNLYAYLQDQVDFFFDTPVETVAAADGGYVVKCKDAAHRCSRCIVSVGRSGITHSLSHASASGVHVARNIAEAFRPDAE